MTHLRRITLALAVLAATATSSVAQIDAPDGTGSVTNLSITVDDDRTEAIPGGSSTYLVTVANDGPADATGVLVTDIFPTPLSCLWTCVGTGGATCTAGQVAGAISDVFDMPAGSDAVYTVHCDIAADATGVLVNRATVTPPATVTDLDPNDNSAVDLDTVLVPTFDLALHKTDGRSTALPGQTMTYTVSISHGGLSDAVSVVVRDELPDDLDDVQWACTPSAGSLCTALGSGDLLDTVTVRAGGELTYVLEGTLASDASGGDLLNIASLTVPPTAVDTNASNNADSDHTEVLVHMDLAVDLVTDRQPAIPGDSLGYSLVVRNDGPADAVDARVVADLPDALRDVVWTCSASAGSSCPAGGSGDLSATVHLVADGTLTFQLDGGLDAAAVDTLLATASVAAPFGALDLDGSNNVATVLTPVTPRADLALTLDAGVDHAVPGLDLVYRLEVDNGGPSDAPGTQLTSRFPASLSCTWTCVGRDGAGCGAGPVAGDIEQVVDLPGGGGLIYTATCAIDPAAVGTLVLGATLQPTANVMVPDPSHLDVQVSTALTPRADIVVGKTDGRDHIGPGETTTYTIEVSNLAGPSDARQVLVRDLFDPVLDCTWTCLGAAGGICTPGQVAGDIDDDVDLPVGARVVYDAVCRVAQDAQGTLFNAATATAPAGLDDPNVSNNSDIDATEIEAAVDLVIDVTDGVDLATPGRSLTYTVTIDNLGPGDALGATVSNVLPSSLSCTWGCLASPGGVCTAGQVTGHIEDTVDLPAAGRLIYTATCAIAPGASGVLANTATVAPAAGIDDRQPENNEASDLDTVLQPEADLAITKGDGVIAAGPGGTVTYTVSVSNLSGPSHAQGADVRDLPPEALQCTWSCAVSGGATCTALPSGSDLMDTVDLPVGSLATFTGQCTIAADASGTLSNTATVTPAAGTFDPQVDNNHATDDDTVLVSAVDLSIRQEVSQEPAVAGGTVVYEVTASHPQRLWIVGESSAGRALFSLDVGSPKALPRRHSLVDQPSLANLPFAMSVTDRRTATTYSLMPGPQGRGQLLALPAVAEEGASEASEPVGTARAIDFADPSMVAGGIAFAPAVDIVGATVSDPFPAPLQCVWTCQGFDGGQCAAEETSGPIDDSVNLPLGASVRYTAACSLAANAVGPLVNSATVAPPAGVVDIDPSNDRATVETAVVKQADLQLSKTDGTTVAHPGTSVTYTLVAANPVGPSDVIGAQVVDFFQPSLTCLWSCQAEGGGRCTPGQVPGDIQDTVDLPVGSRVTYLANCAIDSAAQGTLSNTADLLPPADVEELNEGDNQASDLDTVLAPLADLAVTVTDDRVRAIPGDELTYEVKVTNGGPSDVRRAGVVDEFPPGLSCLWSCAASPGALCTPGQVAGDLLDSIDLPAGGSATYQARCAIAPDAVGILQNGARVSLPTPGIDPQPANDQDADGDTLLVPTADLALTKDNGVDIAHPGGTVTYTLVAENVAGPSTLSRATLADILPAALISCDWSCQGDGGASCSATPGAGDLLDLVDLPPGARAVYTGVCRVAHEAVGNLVNQASLTPPDGSEETNPANNLAADADTLVPLVDLHLRVNGDRREVAAGETLHYLVEVGNGGPSPARNATVTASLDDALSCRWTCESTLGSRCTGEPIEGPLLDVVDVEVDGTLSYQGVCAVDPRTEGTLVEVSGEIVPADGVLEADGSNNIDADSTTVLRRTDLAISKSDGQATALPGETVVYSIGVSNAGPSYATAVAVSDLFPPTLTCTWTCDAEPDARCADGVHEGDLTDQADIGPGAGVLYRATCLIAADATGSLENTARVTTDADLDPDLDNNQATDIDILGDTADLALQLVDNPDPVASGNLLLYQGAVDNLGPLSDAAVTVTLQLSPLVDFVTAFVGEAGQIFADGFESGDRSAWSAGTGDTGADDGADLCQLEGSTLVCSLGQLSAAARLQWTVVVDVTAASGSTLVTTAAVLGAGSDPDSANNSASAITTVGNEDAESGAMEGIR